MAPPVTTVSTRPDKRPAPAETSRTNYLDKALKARIERYDISDADDDEDQTANVTLISDIQSLVSNYDESVTVKVIQHLLEVFNSTEGFFGMVAKHGGPSQVVHHLVTKHELDPGEISEIFKKTKKEAAAPGAASSSGSGKRRTEDKTEEKPRGPEERSRTPRRNSTRDAAAVPEAPVASAAPAAKSRSASL